MMEIIRKMQILCFQIWSTAASQIFFSLSVGYCIIYFPSKSLSFIYRFFLPWIFWPGMAVNWPSRATITSPTIATGFRNLNKPIVTMLLMNECVLMRLKPSPIKTSRFLTVDRAGLERTEAGESAPSRHEDITSAGADKVRTL